MGVLDEDRALARLAADQHGLVTVGQLGSLGLNKTAINHRVKRGRLHRVHRRVYGVGRNELSAHGHFLAAVLALGEGAALSHTSAAALWGFWTFRPSTDAPVEVSLTRYLRQRSGIRIHQCRQLDQIDTTRRHRIPVTTPARTLLDLAETLKSDRALRRTINQALIQHRVSLPLLRKQLERPGGSQKARTRLKAILHHAAPTRSELEDRMLELLHRHGLPKPLTNHRLHGLPGAPEVDFFFADHDLVIEADGEEYHDTPIQRRADAAKQAKLEAAGLRVIRVDWDQATQGHEQTARRVRGALAAREAATT